MKHPALNRVKRGAALVSTQGTASLTNSGLLLRDTDRVGLRVLRRPYPQGTQQVLAHIGCVIQSMRSKSPLACAKALRQTTYLGDAN